MAAPAIADCRWVTPEQRPYSQTEREMLRLLGNAQKQLTTLEAARQAGQPWPTPQVRLEIVTTTRKLTMRKKAIRG